MKKICMIVPSFIAKGGIVSVVGGYRGSALEERYQIHYIETYCDGGKLAKLGKAMSAYLKFIWELAVCKPDLVHIHSSFGGSFFRKLPFIYLSCVRHIPVVNHIHGSEVDRLYHSAPNWKKRLVEHAFSKCDKVIALSEEWKKRFSAFINPENLCVVENYSVVKAPEAGNNLQSRNVLFMGFLKELKGCLDIPEIAARVAAEFPDATFILAGSGDEAVVREITSLAQQQGVAENIQLPGWVRDTEKEHLLRSAAVFFLPSYTEGMPMSILEAMGYGLPIVSTTVGGIPQLVQNGHNGYLLQPGDRVGMAEAIADILRNDEKRKAMGKESAAIIEERYSFARHLEKLTELYESLL